MILDQADARIGELQDTSKQENPGIAEIWNKLINLADKVEEASQQTDEHATEYSAMKIPPMMIGGEKVSWY